MDINQCWAPTSDGTRCLNSTVDDRKMHCKNHLIGIKFYDRYKKLCKIANNLNIESISSISSTKEKIAFLNKCYNSYIRAYEARMKHNTNFVVPECSDWGHKRQFVILKNKINTCELKLEALYKEFLLSKKDIIKVDLVQDDLEVEEVHIIEKIKTFTKKRSDDEKEINKVLKEYIKKNKEVLKAKKDIINRINNIFLVYIPKDSEYTYLQMVCMFNVLVELMHLKICHDKGIYPTNKDILLYNKQKVIKLSDQRISAHISLEGFLSNQYINAIFDFYNFMVATCVEEAIDSILIRVIKSWEKVTVLPSTLFQLNIVGGRFNFKLI